MKPFKFSLEKILRIRNHHEEEAKIELGRAISALAEIENNIILLTQERVRVAADQYNPANSAAMIKQYMFYILRLDSTKEQLLRDAAQAELKVEQAREAFIEASRERKVLDKLKEKQKKKYDKEKLAQEAKILDEVKRR